MTPLKVLFAPFYPKNPYQQLLADALLPLGAEVRGVRAIGVDRPDFMVELRRNPPDLLHLHWLHPYFLSRDRATCERRVSEFLANLDEVRERGIPIVWTAHNLVNHERLHPWLDRLTTARVAARADGIIAHGASARRSVLRSCGPWLAPRVDVVPLGHFADHYPNTVRRDEARARLGIDPDLFVLGFVGRIRNYKGIFDLLHAYKRAELPERTLLLIAGKALDESERRRLKRRVKKLDRVRLDYGYVADESLQVYFNAIDAAVLPYKDILTSSAAVLAMSFGVPVVAPRIGCFVDIVDAGGAVLYPSFGRTSLVRALERTAATREELPAIGAHGKALVERWPWSSAAAKTLEIYRKALTRRKAAAARS